MYGADGSYWSAASIEIKDSSERKRPPASRPALIHHTKSIPYLLYFTSIARRGSNLNSLFDLLLFPCGRSADECSPMGRIIESLLHNSRPWCEVLGRGCD